MRSILKYVGIVGGLLLVLVLFIGFVIFVFGLRDQYYRDVQPPADGTTAYGQFQLLYVQGCTFNADVDPQRIRTLADQLAHCDKRARGGRAGYYLYDFGYKRSIRVTDGLLKALTEKITTADGKEIVRFLFPDSLDGEVLSGNTGYNNITSLDKFSAFPVSCEVTDAVLWCVVDGADGTADVVHRVAEQVDGLDLLVPKGMVEIEYKLTRDAFHPYLFFSNTLTDITTALSSPGLLAAPHMPVYEVFDPSSFLLFGVFLDVFPLFWVFFDALFVTVAIGDLF